MHQNRGFVARIGKPRPQVSVFAVSRFLDSASNDAFRQSDSHCAAGLAGMAARNADGSAGTQRRELSSGLLAGRRGYVRFTALLRWLQRIGHLRKYAFEIAQCAGDAANHRLPIVHVRATVGAGSHRNRLCRALQHLYNGFLHHHRTSPQPHGLGALRRSAQSA